MQSSFAQIAWSSGLLGLDTVTPVGIVLRDTIIIVHGLTIVLELIIIDPSWHSCVSL